MVVKQKEKERAALLEKSAPMDNNEEEKEEEDSASQVHLLVYRDAPKGVYPLIRKKGGTNSKGSKELFQKLHAMIGLVKSCGKCLRM